MIGVGWWKISKCLGCWLFWWLCTKFGVLCLFANERIFGWFPVWLISCHWEIHFSCVHRCSNNNAFNMLTRMLPHQICFPSKITAKPEVQGHLLALENRGREGRNGWFPQNHFVKMQENAFRKFSLAGQILSFVNTHTYKHIQTHTHT